MLVLYMNICINTCSNYYEFIIKNRINSCQKSESHSDSRSLCVCECCDRQQTETVAGKWRKFQGKQGVLKGGKNAIYRIFNVKFIIIS